ncbi:MAG: ribosome biogenesis GTP-binding protein YihA/YsxC [Aquificaceae bacterium]|jgi:GTP-binding protein|uniref:ribosome biogenesis GTP-binding protein YihA/YsxC n=1 Tax=Hydrogenobacter sp. Uz 6-8 TaxID=3384828 RepID=UPI000F2A0DB5|nr:MAG: ribosome biogenesis GTP-binding protein YsxC [Aquificota bacterium]
MKVRFVGSFVKGFPMDDLMHVVFVGRSNVGKSSLINMLVGKDVARVSKEPGRTRAINLFLLEDHGLYLADLPGYGFAKVSKKVREEWKRMIEGYFHACWEDIKLVLLLIDSLVGPTELDIESLNWLQSLNLPHIIALTKCDRASQRELSSTLKKIREFSHAEVVPTSAKEGMGKKELLKYVLS